MEQRKEEGKSSKFLIDFLETQKQKQRKKPTKTRWR